MVTRFKHAIPIVLVFAMLMCGLSAAGEGSQLDAQLNAVVNEVITQEMSAYTRALNLHNWLIYHVNYDLTDVASTPEHVLLSAAATDIGYASTYAALLDAAGVENMIVTNGLHQWNMVHLDDGWYHVDCAWDDPVELSESGEVVNGNQERMTYFAIDDATMAYEHGVWMPLDASAVLPQATSKRYMLNKSNTGIPQMSDFEEKGLTFASVNDLDAQLQAMTDRPGMLLFSSQNALPDDHLMILNWAQKHANELTLKGLWRYGGRGQYFAEVIWPAQDGSYVKLSADHTYMDSCTSTKLEFSEKYPADAVVSWASSRPDVVRVNENGYITALHSGTAQVTATLASGAADTITVEVLPKNNLDFGLTAIRLDDTNFYLEWEAVPGANQYHVYCAFNGACETFYVLTTQATSAQISVPSGALVSLYVNAMRMGSNAILFSHNSRSAGDYQMPYEADYEAVYRYEDYCAQNPDVYSVYGGDRQAMLNHFVGIGMAEGRAASCSFDVHAYLMTYADVHAAFGDALPAYYAHYIQWGQHEGRMAPSYAFELATAAKPTAPPDPREAAYAAVYDYFYYIERYPDLMAAFGANRTAAMDHFLFAGMTEGRIAHPSFDVNAYYSNYEDLHAVLGGDLTAYFQHYMQWGQQEGRVGMPLQ